MLADDLLRAARSRHAKAPARRRSAAWYDDDVPAPAALTVALTNLLYLDGRTMPDSPDRDALFDYVGASRWLRFGLGAALAALRVRGRPRREDPRRRRHRPGRRGRRVRQALADVDGLSALHDRSV